jgi:hypothetical protein
MSWYKTGTINVTNGSNAVTGYNTKWTNPLIGVCSGQMLILQTQNTIEIHEIASIQSDTQLTLAKTYSGTSKTGITYEIPTSPKVSIEALALRVSEMLNYYQIQLDAWQSILTGDGEVTLTAPDGRVVTIRSQLSISNELVKLVEQSRGFAESANKSATTATNASTSAKSYADSASSSATVSHNSAQQSSNSANAASSSERNAKTYEQNAKKSADDAKNWASTIDSSNFIKKTGEEIQSISGSLIVHNVVIKDMIGDQRLMPFRRDELPFGWYFRNGDNFLLDSPQGQALNGLSANYKRDHNITIKKIDGKQYINVPTAFSSDGRGFFERAVNGTNRQVGSWEDDAIRNIKGSLPNGPGRAIIGHENITKGERDGAMSVYHCDDDWLQVGSRRMRWAFFDFDASRVVPTANENRPLNIGMTPAIYLGV